MINGSKLGAQARTELGLVASQLSASHICSGWGKASGEEGSLCLHAQSRSWQTQLLRAKTQQCFPRSSWVPVDKLLLVLRDMLRCTQVLGASRATTTFPVPGARIPSAAGSPASTCRREQARSPWAHAARPATAASD